MATKTKLSALLLAILVVLSCNANLVVPEESDESSIPLTSFEKSTGTSTGDTDASTSVAFETSSQYQTSTTEPNAITEPADSTATSEVSSTAVFTELDLSTTTIEPIIFTDQSALIHTHDTAGTSPEYSTLDSSSTPTSPLIQTESSTDFDGGKSESPVYSSESASSQQASATLSTEDNNEETTTLDSETSPVVTDAAETTSVSWPVSQTTWIETSSVDFTTLSEETTSTSVIDPVSTTIEVITSSTPVPTTTTELPFTQYHNHYYEKYQLIVELRTNIAHEFVCKCLPNKKIEISLSQDPCGEIIDPDGLGDHSESPGDHSESPGSERHECEPQLVDQIMTARAQTQELRNVTCKNVLPNSMYSLYVLNATEERNIPTPNETLTCVKNLTNIIDLKCETPPSCSDCSVEFTLNSSALVNNRTYKPDINDIVIYDELSQSVTDCFNNILVGVLRDPEGLNTAEVYRDQWEVEPDFEESDLDMVFDCEVPSKKGKSSESSNCDDPLIELKGPIIKLTLKNKWKSCGGSYYNMTLFKDTSCSDSANPTFSPIFKYDNAFSSSSDPIEPPVDQDNITFSTKYRLVVSIARYTFTNQLKVQERNKTKQSKIGLLQLSFDNESPIDNQTYMAVTYTRPSRTNLCSTFKIVLRNTDSNFNQTFDVTNGSGRHTFTKLNPGTKYEIYPVTRRYDNDTEGTKFYRWTNVAPATDFRIELQPVTSFNLTFIFQRPAGTFKNLTLCYINTETNKASNSLKTLRKNTLKCSIPITNYTVPFEHEFNNDPMQLEYGNQYEFVLRTYGCDDGSDYCEADSEARSFQMGPDGIVRDPPPINTTQVNSIIVSSKTLPRQIYDNITIFCEAVDPNKNSSSYGKCSESVDVVAQSFQCVCLKLQPGEYYDVIISVNRRHRPNNYSMQLWTQIDKPSDVTVEGDNSNPTSLRICWRYNFFPKNFAFMIMTKRIEDDGTVVAMPDRQCPINVGNSSTCSQEEVPNSNNKRFCFLDSNLRPGTLYQIGVVSSYHPDNAHHIFATHMTNATTNLDRPNNLRIAAVDSKTLQISFVPPKAPGSSTSFELCVYQPDKKHLEFCKTLQYPPVNVSRGLRDFDSIPVADEEVTLTFNLNKNRTSFRTEYALLYTVAKGLMRTRGELCNLNSTNNRVCIAYRVPFPVLWAVLIPILSIFLIITMVGGFLGYRIYRKGSEINKTQIRPSNIAMMLRTRQCEDEWKTLTEISSAYREEHEGELYGRSYYPQKNRYKDILPYEHRRVKLEVGNDGDDYINASHANETTERIHYIAAMGPKETSTDDFWKMIWQKNVKKVVMLTNINEAGVQKCAMYWTDKLFVTTKFGVIQVVLTKKSKSRSRNFIHRSFELRTKRRTKIVEHYQFTSWPDMDDTEPTDILEFIERIKRDTPEDNEEVWVVHCSAGVGRTGTFIAIMLLYENAVKDKNVNLFQKVIELRKTRPGMIQTFNQYKLIYQVLDLIYQQAVTGQRIDPARTQASEVEAGTKNVIENLRENSRTRRARSSSRRRPISDIDEIELAEINETRK